jgi:hypothetical protein
MREARDANVILAKDAAACLSSSFVLVSEKGGGCVCHRFVSIIDGMG